MGHGVVGVVLTTIELKSVLPQELTDNSSVENKHLYTTIWSIQNFNPGLKKMLEFAIATQCLK